MLIGNEPMDLRLTLMDSAQCFHWIEMNGRFGAVVDGAAVWLWQDCAGIHADGNCNRDALRRYLDLDRNYADVASGYAHIPAAREAFALFPGLRVLNQSPWEAVITFILSANNNVTRIRTLVQALCKAYGRRFDAGAAILNAFPTPDCLADCREDVLRALKAAHCLLARVKFHKSLRLLNDYSLFSTEA